MLAQASAIRRRKTQSRRAITVKAICRKRITVGDSFSHNIEHSAEGVEHIEAGSWVAVVIALIIVIIIVVAAVLGLGLLNTSVPSSSVPSNASINATGTTTAQPSVIPSPTATPIPTPSGQQLVVEQGQQFAIALLANSSTGYQWQPTFDTGALALQSQTFASTATSTPPPGAGAIEVFTFQALRSGTTSITFDYVNSTGTVTQSTSYTVVVR